MLLRVTKVIKVIVPLIQSLTELSYSIVLAETQGKKKGNYPVLF